ncbi:hypothetical protein [Deinococcus ruber]|uniref:Lipoprotein n=1 Tax=Deinococcus ruber TaxID=1848197 RepID=A0A918FEH0_9DEIO|nr:hypothetical protein [Deinococcus ruber]GGR33799.1 hypothetical protein GCM10008957_49980 [Deinococcus ruber]
MNRTKMGTTAAVLLSTLLLAGCAGTSIPSASAPVLWTTGLHTAQPDLSVTTTSAGTGLLVTARSEAGAYTLTLRGPGGEVLAFAAGAGEALEASTHVDAPMAGSSARAFTVVSTGTFGSAEASVGTAPDLGE